MGGGFGPWMLLKNYKIHSKTKQNEKPNLSICKMK